MGSFIDEYIFEDYDEKYEEGGTLEESNDPSSDKEDEQLEEGFKHDANFRNVKGLEDRKSRMLDRIFKHPRCPFKVNSVEPYGKEGGCRIRCRYQGDQKQFIPEKAKIEDDIDTAMDEFHVNTRHPPTKDRITFEVAKRG